MIVAKLLSPVANLGVIGRKGIARYYKDYTTSA
jgi:hypothetical protein